MSTHFSHLNEAVTFIQSKCATTPEVGLTLGSGLANFAQKVDVEFKIPFSEIPHFSPSRVVGHPGQLIIGRLNGKSVAVLQGRIHFYEGHSMQQVVFPTRVLGRLGVKTHIVTNAAGGIDPKMTPGHLMIISDHINLTGDNPLRGENLDELGPRFPDMTHPYDTSLMASLEGLMKKYNVNSSQGVYCGVAGPTYETAAEVKYLQKIGGKAVGMSTVPEVIAARHMGLRVAGISCITNLATGISQEKISHDDVTLAAKRVEAQFTDVLVDFIGQL